MGKVRFKQQLDQKFQLRQVSLQIIYNDDNILIKSENATRPLLSELKNELVYDGYAESGEVEEGCIHLYEQMYGCVMTASKKPSSQNWIV